MSRLETGPYRPAPDDWTGVFIRGDEAAWYASMLRTAMNSERDENPIADAAMSGLVAILESCDERKMVHHEAKATECSCPDGAEDKCVDILCPRK